MAKKTKTINTPGEYQVGRGKPPSHSRFQPGQSGNPGGRKKGSRNLKTVLAELMLEEIEMTENGRKRTIPLLEALIKRQMQEGLRGDLRAIKDLLDRYERNVGSEPEAKEELPEDDKALLQRVLLLRSAVPPRRSRPGQPGQDHEAKAGADHE